MRRKDGFALPLVLTLVAMLTLTLAVALVSLRGLKEQTLLAIKGAAFEQQAMTAEARLSYLVATEPFGASTLNIGALREYGGAAGAGSTTAPTAMFFLDERPYRWAGAYGAADAPAYLAQVQDEAGLVNLFQSDAPQLTRLFEWAGIESRDAENLANAIIAYNADPEAHQPMRKPAEIFRLPEAVELISDKTWRILSPRVTLYPDNRSVNINTAPADVLKIWFDMSDAQAQEAVRLREGQTLTSTADIGVVVPVNNRNYVFTGGRLRFIFTDPATGLSRRSTLVLTPNSATRPLWVENPRTLRLPPPQIPEELDDFPQVPDIAA